MKLFLLSDLHLGKRLNEFSLIEDQQYILEEIIRLIDQHQPDAVLVSGDVYDRATPSAEAVRLLDGFINQLAERDLTLFMISGNHDSADRLAFGAQIFRQQNLYIAENFRSPLEPIHWERGDVQAAFYLLPFIKPAQVRAVWPECGATSYDEALAYVMRQLELDPERFNILLAHQYIAGAKLFESDDILIGGIDQVSELHFEGFDLVALGHLHGPQTMGSDRIRYCGSPLKCSFSEAAHQKSVPLITIHPDHSFRTELLPLTPRRDMRVIRGPFDKVSSPTAYAGTNTEDYVQITLTDEFETPDALTKLRAIYPNLMRLQYDNQRTRAVSGFKVSEVLQQQTPLELFQEFYFQQNQVELSPVQQAYFQKLLEDMEVQ